MLRTLLAAVDRVAMALGVVAAMLTVSIVAMILSEIAARTVFNYSLSFAWEYSAYAMGVAMFGGASFALRTGGHIRVSLLAASIPPRIAHWVDVVGTVLATGIAGYIAWALIQFAWRSYLSGSTSPTVSATPLVIPQAGIAIGAAWLSLQMLVRLVRLFLGDPPEDESTSFQVE